MASYLIQQGETAVGPLLQRAFKWVVDTIYQQYRYGRDYKQSVKDLEEKELNSSWVQTEAYKAIQDGEDHVSSIRVENLRDDEKRLLDKAKQVVGEFRQLQGIGGIACCGYVCHPWRRYSIGRKAQQCIQNIDDFRTKAHLHIVGDEIRSGDGTDENIVKPKACELKSRVDVINEVIRVLEDDSIRRVGLWGPEGAGKSMLIDQVLYRVNKWGNLQRVRIEVPQKRDEINIEEEIQRQIFKKIYPKLPDNCSNIKERARRINNYFSIDAENKSVIILDGLWRQIDLDEIGIPDNDKIVCNVILTARDMDLLVNDMGLSRDRTFQVGPLSPAESTKLFLYFIGRSEQAIDEEKKCVAGDLVHYCGGLPKLIKQVANNLTNQRDIYAWHDALREIKSQNIEKMLGPVEETLSTCFSNENDLREIRSLFKLCGLFEESSILVRDLIIHCWALGIFPQDITVKETKDRVKRLLHILRARSLVDGNNHEVIITDLLREVAVHFARQENYLFIRNGSKYERSGFKKWTLEQLKQCTALSINGLDVLKDNPKLDYPMLKMLQLGSKDDFLKIDEDKFFKHMSGLRGLHLNKIEFVSSSCRSFVGNLGNLQSLCLDGCQIKDLRHIGNLKKLQILKISRSDIIELPEDLGHLTDLRLLDLRDCYKLQVIEHGILSNLKGLEELYLDDSFDQWEEPQYKLGPSKRRASLAELNEMNSLSSLHVYVPKSTMLPENLKLEKLEKYKILLGDVRNYSDKNVKVRTLRLDLSDSASILWEEWVIRMMQRTKSLCLKGMMQMPKPSIRQLCSQGFPCLNDLHLENCGSVEYIVESSELILAFPNLESLTLVNLKNLRKICNGPVMDGSFGQLNVVAVESCHALENLFDFSVMERISAFKKIEVKDCENMKEIVTDDVGRKGGRRKKITWNKLCHLSLENLKQIVSFCNPVTMQTSSESIRPGSMSEPTAFFDGELISFPGLESLSLIGLPNARKILYQNIPLQDLGKLQSLTVEGFEEASEIRDILIYSRKTTPQQAPAYQKHNFGFSWLKARVDLDSHIQSPQGLMTSEMESREDRKNIAQQTKTLVPEGHLQRNSSHQNLRYLILCGFATQKFLFTTSMAQALPQLTELTIARCEMMEEVIKVDNGVTSVKIQKLTALCLESLENLTTFSRGTISIEFSSLKSLKISGCHKLTTLFADSKDDEVEEEISGSLFHNKVSPSFNSLDDLKIWNMNKLIRIWQCQAHRHGTSSQHGGESGGSSSKDFATKLWRTFLNIKKLKITNCESLERILDVEGSLDPEVTDNDNHLDCQLNEVHFEGLEKLEHIWSGNDPRGRKIRYRYLERVSLCKCQRIESLFPASMTKNLLRLQSLTVKSCDGIKHIIGKENPLSEDDVPEFFFPAVNVLELQELPRLVTFYFGPHCSEWPSLERITVTKCDSVKIFGSSYKKSQPKSQVKSQANQTPLPVRLVLRPESPIAMAIQSLEEKRNKGVPLISVPESPLSCGVVPLQERNKKEEMDSLPLFSVKKDSFCRLSTLELSQNLMMKQIWGDLNPVEFRKLKVLKLISSSNEPVPLPIKFLLKSPHLESLQVHNHDCLIKMMKTSERQHPCLWPVEQSLTVKSLSKVELCKIPEMTDLKQALDSLLGASSYSFGSLTSLEVSNCHLLEYLFTFSTAKGLGCLTRLTVANCKSMKVIVANEEGKMKDKAEVGSEEGDRKDKVVGASKDSEMKDKAVEASEEGKTKNEVVLNKLECLTLDSLEELISFCEENYKFELPSLEEITVRGCSNMKWFTHGETSSPNLIKVELKGTQIDVVDERNLNKIIDKEMHPRRHFLGRRRRVML